VGGALGISNDLDRCCWKEFISFLNAFQPLAINPTSGRTVAIGSSCVAASPTFDRCLRDDSNGNELALTQQWASTSFVIQVVLR
jgi:hypothetical protein